MTSGSGPSTTPSVDARPSAPRGASSKRSAATCEATSSVPTPRCGTPSPRRAPKAVSSPPASAPLSSAIGSVSSLSESSPVAFARAGSATRSARPTRHEIWRGDQSHSGKQYQWDVNNRTAGHRRDDRSHRLHARRLRHLVAAAYADGKVDLRMPDAVGNLFRTAERSDRKYGSAGQLLESNDARGTTRYAYDPEGNLIQKVEPGGSTWTYSWNAAGMLVRVMRPNGHAVEFAYDALARRTLKSYRGKTTRWIWDASVPLHEWVERAADAVDEQFVREPRRGLPGNERARVKALLSGRPANGPPAQNNGSRPGAHTGTADAPITWLFEPGDLQSARQARPGRELWNRDRSARYAHGDVRCDRPRGVGANIDTYGELSRRARRPPSVSLQVAGAIRRRGDRALLQPVQVLRLAVGHLRQPGPDKIQGRSGLLLISVRSHLRIRPVGAQKLLPRRRRVRWRPCRKAARKRRRHHRAWDHVRRESNESSVFTSFSETQKCRKFTKDDNVYKIKDDDLKALQDSGQVKFSPQTTCSTR